MSTTAGDESAPETGHLATIDWQRGKRAGAKGKYSREHLWHLVGVRHVGRELSSTGDEPQGRSLIKAATSFR